jgi:hypothetical protein
MTLRDLVDALSGLEAPVPVTRDGLPGEWCAPLFQNLQVLLDAVDRIVTGPLPEWQPPQPTAVGLACRVESLSRVLLIGEDKGVCRVQDLGGLLGQRSRGRQLRGPQGEEACDRRLVLLGETRPATPEYQSAIHEQSQMTHPPGSG